MSESSSAGLLIDEKSFFNLIPTFPSPIVDMCQARGCYRERDQRGLLEQGVVCLSEKKYRK